MVVDSTLFTTILIALLIAGFLLTVIGVMVVLTIVRRQRPPVRVYREVMPPPTADAVPPVPAGTEAVTITKNPLTATTAETMPNAPQALREAINDATERPTEPDRSKLWNDDWRLPVRERDPDLEVIRIVPGDTPVEAIEPLASKQDILRLIKHIEASSNGSRANTKAS